MSPVLESAALHAGGLPSTPCCCRNQQIQPSMPRVFYPRRASFPSASRAPTLPASPGARPPLPPLPHAPTCRPWHRGRPRRPAAWRVPALLPSRRRLSGSSRRRRSAPAAAWRAAPLASPRSSTLVSGAGWHCMAGGAWQEGQHRWHSSACLATGLPLGAAQLEPPAAALRASSGCVATSSTTTTTS